MYTTFIERLLQKLTALSLILNISLYLISQQLLIIPPQPILIKRYTRYSSQSRVQPQVNEKGFQSKIRDPPKKDFLFKTICSVVYRVAESV